MSPVISTEKFEPHAAGVLAILPFSLPITASTNQNIQDPGQILLTGGYDDYFRVYMTSTIRPGNDSWGKPKVLAELYIGHGVYRLKFLQDPYPIPKSPEIRLK